MYFRAIVADRRDLSFAKREAKAEAIKNIAEKINIRVRTEFEISTRGSNINSNNLSNFTSDVIAWMTDNLNIQGISPVETFWQKTEMKTHEGYEYSYNVYILTAIPISDYKNARKLAILNLMKKYQDQGMKEAEKIAEEVKKRLLENDM